MVCDSKDAYCSLNRSIQLHVASSSALLTPADSKTSHNNSCKHDFAMSVPSFQTNEVGHFWHLTKLSLLFIILSNEKKNSL